MMLPTIRIYPLSGSDDIFKGRCTVDAINNSNNEELFKWQQIFFRASGCEDHQQIAS